jgi:SAM-dependent methyltransferase
MATGYESFFQDFDSPLMQTIRREAYGEDIGQHSWVSAQELRADIKRLALSSASRCLDLGCGPCGPLSFIVSTVGCQGVGLDLSASAVRVGRARAVSLGIDALLSVEQHDLNEPLPVPPSSFDAIVSLDVVLHLRDRLILFSEVARVLRPGGRFLFTDAGVVTGAVSNEEVRRRSTHGHTQFVPPGWNEHLLEQAGLRLVESANRTANMTEYARGRLRAIRAHRTELEQVLSSGEFESQVEYLETVIEVSRRAALSRIMFLALRSHEVPQ